MQVPVFVKIDKELSIRPASEDIVLTDLWEPVEEFEETRELVGK